MCINKVNFEDTVMPFKVFNGKIINGFKILYLNRFTKKSGTYYYCECLKCKDIKTVERDQLVRAIKIKCKVCIKNAKIELSISDYMKHIRGPWYKDKRIQ